MKQQQHVIPESTHPVGVSDSVSHTAACALMWTHNENAQVSLAERGGGFSLCHKNGFSTPKAFLPLHSSRVRQLIIFLTKIKRRKGKLDIEGK